MATTLVNHKSSIAPAALQQVLDAAANAGQKGQAQWHTPAAWGRALALPLPQLRPNIVDLTCGNGALLAAARLNHSQIFGVEIEPSLQAATRLHRITADVTRLLPLFKGAGFAADCFVLNLPWDTHWYRERLALLAQSDEPAVQAAFAAHDGRTRHDTIDSTVAGFCLALELGSLYSEGFLIGNEATLQRLILRADAPHAALAQHVWAHLVVSGNICAPEIQANFQAAPINTGIIYFANSHTDGGQAYAAVSSLDEARQVLQQWQRDRITLRRGAEMASYVVNKTLGVLPKWKAVAEEWTRLNDVTKSQYNLWLHDDGTIRTALSLFDEASGRLKDQAAKLHELNGKHPRQLVMQMAQRKALLALVAGRTPGAWRVDPALTAAVDQSVSEYQSQRAPLVALNPVQRLGYLDEADVIVCTQNLGEGNPLAPGGLPLFAANSRYPIRTTTVMVKRQGRKLNLHGAYDDVQWDGQELAIFIQDELGQERLFMEGRLRQEHVKVSVVAPGQAAAFKRLGIADVATPCAIDFTLEELVGHFIVPDVPDVAALNPAGHQRNLALLKLMEALVNG